MECIRGQGSVNEEPSRVFLQTLQGRPVSLALIISVTFRCRALAVQVPPGIILSEQVWAGGGMERAACRQEPSQHLPGGLPGSVVAGSVFHRQKANQHAILPVQGSYMFRNNKAVFWSFPPRES